MAGSMRRVWALRHQTGAQYSVVECAKGRGRQKVLTMSQVLSSTADLLQKDLRFEHGGTKLVSCPMRHLTSLPTCVWSKTDTLTIATRTSQPIVTSAHYTVLVKASDCAEYLVTNWLKIPWPLSLRACVLFEKSQLRKILWRRIFCKIVAYSNPSQT